MNFFETNAGEVPGAECDLADKLVSSFKRKKLQSPCHETTTQLWKGKSLPREIVFCHGVEGLGRRLRLRHSRLQHLGAGGREGLSRPCWKGSKEIRARAIMHSRSSKAKSARFTITKLLSGHLESS